MICIFPCLKSNNFLYLINLSCCYSFLPLRRNFPGLTIISHLHLSSSFGFSLSVVCTLPYRFPVKYFDVHETAQHFLHLILAPSDSFVQFPSISLLGFNIRWDFRWCTLSFISTCTFVFRVVRQHMSFPSSCLCITFLLNSVAVPQVARDVFLQLQCRLPLPS